MEPLDGVEALARIARLEVAPTTNVRVGPLLRTFRAEQQWRLAPLAWSAGLSAAAACVILVLALRQTQSTSVDSISPLFNATQVQMP